MSAKPGNRDGRKVRDRRVSKELQAEGPDRRTTANDRRSEQNLRFVSFRVAGWLAGVRVERVQEVLSDRPITVVPLAAAELAGLLNLRGQVVSVVDLRVRLGLERRPAGTPAMSLVIREGSELFSLLVDSIGDVVDVASSSIKETPANLDPAWRACCEGVVRLPGGGLMAALDVSHVLAPSENGAAGGSDTLVS